MNMVMVTEQHKTTHRRRMNMSSKHIVQKMPTKLVVVDTQQEARRQADNTASLMCREVLMTVEQVIERTKEWVSMQAEQLPGFLGAHLMGGITSMALCEPFPAYRDVDLHIILKDDTDVPGENVEALYRGLMIEAGFRRQTDYSTPEVVLADPVIAGHMAVPSILSDPTGFLTRLHEAVAQEYARRKWVQARCEAEKREAFGKLEIAAHIPNPDPIAAFGLLGYAGTYVAAVLSLASLKAITGRRSYIQMGRILESWGRTDLYERLLKVVGIVQASRDQAERYLRDATEAFDLAVKVKRTPHPFGHKMYAHLRPYLVEGSQEMMDEGYCREAVGWTKAFYSSSMQIIQIDAPSQLTSDMQAKFDECMSQLWLDGAVPWETRMEEAKAIFREVFMLADEIIACNPAIFD
jgi:hypothetical protein